MELRQIIENGHQIEDIDLLTVLRFALEDEADIGALISGSERALRYGGGLVYIEARLYNEPYVYLSGLIQINFVANQPDLEVVVLDESTESRISRYREDLAR